MPRTGLIGWLRGEVDACLGAVGYFTRLPVPARVGDSAAALNQSAKYLPAVGRLVGGLGALVFWLTAQLWPQPVAVLLAMAATLYATGAFHEDGLADTADGLGGGWDKAKILAIMKDSRVGSYGVIAIVLALLGKYTLLISLPAEQVGLALIAGHALSRGCAVSLMAFMDYARDDAASKSRPVAGRLGIGALLFALACTGWPLLFFAPAAVLAGVGLAALATLWLAGKCRRWLGGYTGDCLGAIQQLAEIGFYLGLASRL